MYQLDVSGLIQGCNCRQTCLFGKNETISNNRGPSTQEHGNVVGVCVATGFLVGGSVFVMENLLVEVYFTSASTSDGQVQSLQTSESWAHGT